MKLSIKSLSQLSKTKPAGSALKLKSKKSNHEIIL